MFTNNFLRNLASLILVMLAGVSIYLAIYYYNKPAEKIKVPIEVEKLVTIEVEAATKKIKDKGGVEHAILDDRKNVIDNISDLDPASRDTISKLAQRLEITEKQLKHYVSYTATIERKYAQAVRLNDSTYRHSSPNLTVDFHLRGARDGSSRDTSFINYRYQAGINYAEYETKGFLGVFNKQRMIDVWLDDPNATLSGMQRFKIKPKPDNFGVSLNATGMLLEDKPYVGPGIDVRIGRSTFTGEYLRDFSDKKWTPSFRYKFNLLEL